MDFNLIYFSSSVFSSFIQLTSITYIMKRSTLVLIENETIEVQNIQVLPLPSLM